MAMGRIIERPSIAEVLHGESKGVKMTANLIVGCTAAGCAGIGCGLMPALMAARRLSGVDLAFCLTIIMLLALQLGLIVIQLLA